MAKQNYLELTNRILRRINQSVITDVSAATGTALIVTNLINEAQNELFTETNWYSLYKMRTFSTVTYTASTISFADANPDTIDDSGSGLGNFEAGMEVLVSGSTSNDGVYSIGTAAAGSLTLQSSDELTVEAAGASITLTAVSYPFASDHGRTLDMQDVTNNNFLVEDIVRIYDMCDADLDSTGTLISFAVQGNNYRFYPVPAGSYKVRERYYMVPTELTANADTSDLPIEVENCLIQYSHMKVLEYMNKFEAADRVRVEFERLLRNAKKSNEKKIDKLRVIDPINGVGAFGIQPTRLPSNYPGMRY
jgi:hypothetical protein